ncbi:MAG: serine kinase [Spirochaetota bacterium]|nr:serine kinase [Spirochaetota bacterium]
MKLNEIVKNLEMQIKTGADHLDVEVARGYCSDMLSDVIANANESDIWITMQIHQNIVAVAVMKSLSGIILINGREPEEATIAKATEENVAILTSDLPAFELVGRLYKMGIYGV